MTDFVQEFFTSRQNYPDGNTRLGQLDRLWYDSITNTIRISDGITPGGIIVSGGGGGSSGYSGYSGYSGTGTGASNWILETSDYLSVNGDRIIANTQAGVFSIFLPASPNLGDYVQITDGWDFAINNCIVDRNGSTIEGYPDNVALDLKGVTFEFIFSGTTWEVTGTTGARGQSGYSGFSGAGFSGYSGFSGSGGSGYSGYSGMPSPVVYDGGTPYTDFSVGFNINCGGVY